MEKLDTCRIKLALNDRQVVFVRAWFERLTTEAQYLWADPTLIENMLSIHPADFANLCSFAETADCSEFEYYQFRKLGDQLLQSELRISKAKLTKELFEMASGSLQGLRHDNFQEDLKTSQLSENIALNLND